MGQPYIEIICQLACQMAHILEVFKWAFTAVNNNIKKIKLISRNRTRARVSVAASEYKHAKFIVSAEVAHSEINDSQNRRKNREVQ